MLNRPVMVFDTSVHNRMMKDGLQSEAIFAALQSGYVVRIIGIAIEELMATPDCETRTRLIASVGRLMNGSHDCLLTQNEIVTRLIRAYEADPVHFQWGRVDITSPEYTAELTGRTLTADDTVASYVRRNLRDSSKQFDRRWSELRSELEEIYHRHGAQRPLTFGEEIPHVIGESGLFWGIAKDSYDWAASTPASDETVRHFVEACPPFRCAVYAILMAWYDRSLREYQGGERFLAGRNDLFMAVYLPYCNQFISAEENGQQGKCLAEVARLANVATLVRSYDDFCSGLLVPVAAA
ncbi:MAG: hypothetical protein ACYCOR_18685 [Acidobacteriaceae bacterium]